MAIRDRGKLKWQSAFFMPEHVSMLRKMRTDYEKQRKPIVDEYEIEVFENLIHEAMEYTLNLKVKIWEEGFIKNYTGLVHRLDEIQKVIYIEEKEGNMERILFNDIVGVEVVE